MQASYRMVPFSMTLNRP